MKTAKGIRPYSDFKGILFFSVSVLSFLFLLTVPGIRLGAEDSSSLTLWITSDIEGYLVGCDCPSGASAGLSAVADVLNTRRAETDLLLDAGGFREAMRSDPLLESFMDEAAEYLGYSGLAAVAGDYRDGRRDFNRRSRRVPLSAAAGTESSGFIGKLAGEDRAMILSRGSLTLGLVQWAGSLERDLVESESRGKLLSLSPSESLSLLDSADSDFHLLLIRGGLEDWDTLLRDLNGNTSELLYLPDLLVFTGPDSPSAQLPGGASSGELPIPGSAGKTLSWISLAPRGNALARVVMVEGEKPEVEIISLERGVSPENERILAMGDSYMEELIAGISAGSDRGKKNQTPSTSVSDGEEPDFKPVYWYPYGCKSCEDFLWNTVPQLERRTGKVLQIDERDTGDPESFEELQDLIDEKGLELESIPVMLIADTVLQGDQEIKSGLEEIMRGRSAVSESSGEREAASVRWEPGAVFLAGLLDGVNPCAFSAMVFLVSALAMAGRSKRTMLSIGMFYALGIFITYSLIGAGLLGGLRRIAVTSGLRSILEWVLAGFLLLLSLLSVLDGIRISRGRNDLILKLPEKLSKRVHRLIREEVRSGAAAGGAFLLGAVVALIELGCTGQVYLPTIAWMISRGSGSLPWFWLLLYNTAFIIPLFIVFAVSYRGVSAVKLAAVFRKRGASLKFFTAGLLTLLAFVLIIT